MKNELLLLIKKNTDTLIEQTKTKPRGILEFKMNKQMETISFSPPIVLVEEGKWLLGVTSFECIIFVFKITNENKCFSITTLCNWNSESTEKTNNELKSSIGLRSENDIELHVEQVGRKRIFLKEYYSVSSLGTFKNEICEVLKKSKYNDLEDMVYSFQLTYWLKL